MVNNKLGWVAMVTIDEDEEDQWSQSKEATEVAYE
jgi:hypothetical protein